MASLKNLILLQCNHQKGLDQHTPQQNVISPFVIHSLDSTIAEVATDNFEFGPVVQEEMRFKGISYLQPFFSVEQNHLCNFGRGYYMEQFCEIILNLGQ